MLFLMLCGAGVIASCWRGRRRAGGIAADGNVSEKVTE